MPRFLLAQLDLGSLVGKRSPKALKVALQSLPTGSEAYDRAYDEAMQRIENQIPESQELAKQVLAWIIFAERPLTTSELRHALAIEKGSSELDTLNLPELEDMIGVCAGLVTTDELSDTIRLVHYTTQEYFERHRKSLYPIAQDYITDMCLTYLSFTAFETGECQNDREFEDRKRRHVLYDYSACNWGHHARMASTETNQAVLKFLRNDMLTAASGQIMLISQRPKQQLEKYSHQIPQSVIGPHLAANFGLVEALATLLSTGYPANMMDSFNNTPLFWAAQNGQTGVVELLLTRSDVEINSHNKYGCTPLSLAALGSHENVMELLLTRADVYVAPRIKDCNPGLLNGFLCSCRMRKRQRQDASRPNRIAIINDGINVINVMEDSIPAAISGGRSWVRRDEGFQPWYDTSDDHSTQLAHYIITMDPTCQILIGKVSEQRGVAPIVEVVVKLSHSRPR
jgi:hypothetical protein